MHTKKELEVHIFYETDQEKEDPDSAGFVRRGV